MPSITDSKTVLVIGATAGIGRALALAIHQLPSKPTVVVAGRRKERLDEIVKHAESTGEGRLGAVQVDVNTGREALQSFAQDVVNAYPDLDTIIFSAGIQHQIDFTKPEEINLNDITSEFNTNYVAILTLITSFLPHLLKLGKQNRPTFIVPISSGLAIVPNPMMSNYCATKAALHSLSLSLHTQLQGTNVHVMEIIPPLVESELHDEQPEGTTAMLSKRWMPLDEFTKVAMEGLKRGDFQILPSQLIQAWEKYDRGKAEHCAEIFARRVKK